MIRICPNTRLTEFMKEPKSSGFSDIPKTRYKE